MEITGLENLERQIIRLLGQYKQVKQERDELAERVNHLETEVSDLRNTNADLRAQVEEARRNARDPVKEELIRAKVDELLAKLEGFEA